MVFKAYYDSDSDNIKSSVPFIFNDSAEFNGPAIFNGSVEYNQPAAFNNGILSISPDNENVIINGAFDVWQRGDSSDLDGYRTADRWRGSGNGGTVNRSRQQFTPGTKLGINNPENFFRHSISGHTDSDHYSATVQYIEDVRTYAGETITVLGWTKLASGSGDICLEMGQYFGPSGSTGTSFGSTTITVDLDWTGFAVPVTIPSITGKTIDTNNSLDLTFWLSAGSQFNSRTNSLGLQTLAVDFWGIHTKRGTHTTDALQYYKAPFIGDEIVRCQRYYQLTYVGVYEDAINTNDLLSADVNYLTYMRGFPTASENNVLSSSNLNASYPPTLVGSAQPNGATIRVVANAAGAVQYQANWNFDAEL